MIYYIRKNELLGQETLPEQDLNTKKDINITPYIFYFLAGYIILGIISKKIIDH